MRRRSTYDDVVVGGGVDGLVEAFAEEMIMMMDADLIDNTSSVDMTFTRIDGHGGGGIVVAGGRSGAGETNGTMFTSTDQRAFSDACNILIYSFLSGLTLITIMGNTLVILAVASTRRLRSVTNCFIVSLSVADLLVGILVMPLSLVYDIIDQWPFGAFLCELWSSLDIMLCTASILNLCCISLDRYFAITRPLTYTVKRNKRLALGMIAVVWVASTAVTCPPWLGWFDRDITTTSATNNSVIEGEEDKDDDDQCRYITDIGYVIFSASGSFYIPLVVMLFVYTRIFVVIYRRNKVVKQQKQYQKSSCCGNGCLPDSSNGRVHHSTAAAAANKINDKRPPSPAMGGGGDGRSRPGILTNGGPCRAFLRGSHRDLRSSNSDYLVSLEMVSDSLLAMRPRCDSSTASINAKRESLGGLQRSRSYQFHFKSKSSSLSEVVSPLVTMTRMVAASTVAEATTPPAAAATATMATVVATASSSSPSPTVKTHLLAVPEWSRGTRSASTSSSGALNLTTTTSSSENYTDSPTTTTGTGTGSAAAAARPKASLPGNLGISSDEHTDLCLRVSITSRPSPSSNVHRDLRRKQIRGLRMSFRKETKATTTIAVVVGGFIVCWLPFFIVYIMNPFCDACNFSRLFVSCLSWLGWANSAVNPFIYAFYNMDFRSAFWRLTIGRCRKKADEKAKAVVVYPQVWRSRLKSARVNGLPSIVMVQSDVM